MHFLKLLAISDEFVLHFKTGWVTLLRVMTEFVCHLLFLYRHWFSKNTIDEASKTNVMFSVKLTIQIVFQVQPTAYQTVVSTCFLWEIDMYKMYKLRSCHCFNNRLSSVAKVTRRMTAGWLAYSSGRWPNVIWVTAWSLPSTFGNSANHNPLFHTDS